MKKNVIGIWQVIIWNQRPFAVKWAFFWPISSESQWLPANFVVYEKFLSAADWQYYKQEVKCIKKNKYDISFDGLNTYTHLSFLTWTPVFSNRRYAVTFLFTQSQVPVRVQIVSTLWYWFLFIKINCNFWNDLRQLVVPFKRMHTT